MGTNNPVNEDSMNWQDYRLSLSRMKYIAETSNHFRATYNFPTEGLLYRDYAQAKLDGFEIFGMQTIQAAATAPRGPGKQPMKR